MKTPILALLFFVSFQAKGSSPSIKISNKIVKNNPEISKNRSLKIAKLIIEMSKKYDIPSNIYTAILMQESAYKINAKNCKNNKCYDYGISQINIMNVKHYKLSIKRLTSDLRYSIEAGAMILSYFKKHYGHKEKDWWTRYNAGNPIKRQEYKRKVTRFL